MTMTTVIIIALWILTIVAYIVFNLYNKNKKLENIVIRQSNFTSSLISTMSDLDKSIEKIDSTIWVQSDPALLSLFDSVKDIQSQIKDFIDN